MHKILKKFSKNLERSGVEFKNIIPVYCDSNFITIMIETEETNRKFTKKV